MRGPDPYIETVATAAHIPQPAHAAVQPGDTERRSIHITARYGHRDR